MARRRGSRVPFADWVKAFAIYNTTVSKAYDDWAAQTPERLPRAFGAVYRIVLNKFALPKIHMLLVQGKPLGEAIKAAIDEAVALIEKNPKIVEIVLKRLGIKADAQTYVKLIREAANYLIENLQTYLSMAEEEYSAKYGVQAAPQAQPITVPA